MRQFYLANPTDRDLSPGDTVTLDGDESHHLFTVLRTGRQDQFRLTDGRGRRMLGELLGKAGRLAEVRIVAVAEDLSENDLPRLILACAVVKGKRFEWALEKAVEVGVNSFWPLLTDQGVIDPRERKQERWLHILRSALKQSGRALLPELSEPLTLVEAVRRMEGAPALYGDVRGSADSADEQVEQPKLWTDLLTSVPGELPDRLALFVGPEGGWSDGERRLLTNAGFQAVDLGAHVLRTETAATVGMAALQSLRRHWQQGMA